MLGLDASARAYVLLDEFDVDSISDYDEEEALYTVEEISDLQNLDTSSIGRRRPSTLSGIKIKDKNTNKKKRGLIKQLQSSMRRLHSREMK